MAVPNFRLDEKTAFITGSASGIGRAIAPGIAASGANFACFDHPGADLEKVAEDIRAAGARAITVAGDVTDARTLKEAVQLAQDKLGPLSLAVNSVGIANAASAEGMSAEQWQRVIDVNLTGVFLARRKATPCWTTALEPAGSAAMRAACHSVRCAPLMALSSTSTTSST